MKKATTSERLLLLMRQRQLRQVDILRLCRPYCEKYNVKLNRNDLSQYVSGKVEPSQFKLTILASALNVSEPWLMGYGDAYEAPTQPIPTGRVPLLGVIACGVPILADENIESYIDVPAFVHADFALRCRGDSMINARIFDGDVVFIRKQETVDNGEIAAVLVENEATLKKVYFYPDRVELRAENPTFKPIEYSGADKNEITILGKAVWFLSQIR